MNHPQIIRLIDVYLTAESLQIVMEAYLVNYLLSSVLIIRAEGQELFDEILSRKVFSEQDAREIITKVIFRCCLRVRNSLALVRSCIFARARDRSSRFEA